MVVSNPEGMRGKMPRVLFRQSALIFWNSSGLSDYPPGFFHESIKKLIIEMFHINFYKFVWKGLLNECFITISN